jgi:hypothetical protein
MYFDLVIKEQELNGYGNYMNKNVEELLQMKWVLEK